MARTAYYISDYSVLKTKAICFTLTWNFSQNCILQNVLNEIPDSILQIAMKFSAIPKFQKLSSNILHTNKI